MDLKRVAKFAGIGIVAIIALVGILFVAGIIGVPDGGLEDNSWGEVDDERIEVITTVWVDNPNPVGGGNADVEYDVSLQGVRLAEGTGTDVSVPTGRSTQNFSTDLFYNRLPEWWYRHLTNDEVSDVRANATVHTSVGPLSASPSGSYQDTVDTDIEGALDRGFSEFEGTYSGTEADVRTPDGTAIQPTVEVREVSTEWGEVTRSETEILVTAEIHNPNAYPIPTPGFTGYLALNDIRVADWDAGEVSLRDAPDDATIPAGETEQRTFVVVMDNQNVPEWFATHVERGEQTDVEVAGQLAMEISGSEITIPQAENGVSCEFFLTTSIFVDDQETDMEFQECGVAPLEIAQSELEAAGGTLDLTETDWWEQLGGDDGPLRHRTDVSSGSISVTSARNS